MKPATQRNTWSELLNLYAERNAGRATRLGVFEEGNDYWLEDGLKLEGIGLDLHGETPTISVMLQGFTHTVKGVTKVTMHLATDPVSEGLDITADEGITSVLRYEV